MTDRWYIKLCINSNVALSIHFPVPIIFRAGVENHISWHASKVLQSGLALGYRHYASESPLNFNTYSRTMWIFWDILFYSNPFSRDGSLLNVNVKDWLNRTPTSKSHLENAWSKSRMVYEDPLFMYTIRCKHQLCYLVKCNSVDQTIQQTEQIIQFKSTCYRPN